MRFWLGLLAAIFVLPAMIHAADSTPPAALVATVLPTPPADAVVSVAGRQGVYLLLYVGDGRQVWLTDGTPKGTRKLCDLPDYGFGDHALGDRLITSRRVADGRFELIAIAPDGKIQTLTTVNQMMLLLATPAGDRLVIPAGDLLSTDGTPKGTVVLRKAARSPIMLTTVGPTPATALFVDEGSVCMTDGTPANTRSVYAIRTPGGAGYVPTMLAPPGVRVGNRCVFAVHDLTGNAMPLMSTDGTTGGTFVIDRQLQRSTRPRDAGGATTVGLWNGRAYFLTNGIRGERLISTDGGRGSVTTLAEFVADPAMPKAPGSGELGHTIFLPLSDKLLLTAYVGPGKFPLWSTDGTPGGTKPLAIPIPGEVTDMDLYGVVAGTRAVINVHRARTQTHEVWLTDGTPGGTQRLAEGHSLVGAHNGLVYLLSPDGRTAARKLP